MTAAESIRHPVAVICALEEELCHLRAMLPAGRQEWHAGRLYEVTEFAGRQIVLARCGIGMLSAAALAEGLIGRCPDAGICLPLLERVRARHRITRERPAPLPGLVEQLSEREMAVLRYLPSTLSLPEIARELFVSPNTVKTQCSAIYRKLAVTSRQAAVQAAREHHLL